MNPRQRRFVLEYLFDLDPAQAAVRAGYAEKAAARTGARLLGIKEVREAISAARADRRAVAGRDWIINGLVENARRALRAVPVLDRKGNETGVYAYQGAVANRALELLGRHFGMFKDRHEHTGPGGGPIRMEDGSELSDTERAHRILKILERARERGDGPAADGGDACLDAAPGPADGSL